MIRFQNSNYRFLIATRVGKDLKAFTFHIIEHQFASPTQKIWKLRVRYYALSNLFKPHIAVETVAILCDSAKSKKSWWDCWCHNLYLVTTKNFFSNILYSTWRIKKQHPDDIWYHFDWKALQAYSYSLAVPISNLKFPLY